MIAPRQARHLASCLADCFADRFAGYLAVIVAGCLAGVILAGCARVDSNLERPREAPVARTPISFVAVSFNIRYDNPADGENSWPYRKDRVAGLLRFHQADIAGLQEALAHQIRDLEERLPEHAWFGVGRDDGEAAGEFSPVFYRRDRFRVLRTGVRWLSESPEEPGSIGWDAACPRIVTWGELEDKRTQRRLVIFNTHFDHRGPTAREQSAAMLRALIDEVASDQPVVVMGDFNCGPSSAPIRRLTAGASPIIEARAHSLLPAYGPETTWNGFTTSYGISRPKIDHILVRPETRVVRHGVLNESVAGRFPSDHFAVLAELSIP